MWAYNGQAIYGKDYLNDPVNSVEYTKHYYVGSECVGSRTGTMDQRDEQTILGYFPMKYVQGTFAFLPINNIRQKSTDHVTVAQTLVGSIFTAFGQQVPAFNPVVEGELTSTIPHDASKLNMYYFHPDHLGSSSYITNKEGKVSQHMEYLPFGETLVDEHVNSNNSPFKFNGKEYDEETGNYYYSARYYDPKLSIFISVDPLAEKYLNYSPFAYTFNNPVRFVDPTGMEAETLDNDGWIKQYSNGYATYTYDSKVTTVEEAKAAGYKNVANVSQQTRIVNVSENYTYDLNSNGSVTDYDGNGVNIIGSLETGGGSTIETNSSINFDNLSNQVGQVTDAIGLGIGVQGGIIDAAIATADEGNVIGAAKNLSKVVNFLGKATGIAGTASSMYEAYKNPSLGSYTKVAVNLALLAARANPVNTAISIFVGIMDVAVASDAVYDSIDGGYNKLKKIL